jgi:hypothetical protein
MNNALSRILQKADNILYKKVGKKYVQQNDPWAYEGLGPGWWLVQVKAGGGTSMRSLVYPRRAEIVAAAKEKADQLMKIIREAGEAGPSKKEISPEALADWKIFIAKHGEEFNMISYPSYHGFAAKIVEEIMKDQKPGDEKYF